MLSGSYFAYIKLYSLSQVQIWLVCVDWWRCRIVTMRVQDNSAVYILLTPMIFYSNQVRVLLDAVYILLKINAMAMLRLF